MRDCRFGPRLTCIMPVGLPGRMRALRAAAPNRTSNWSSVPSGSATSLIRTDDAPEPRAAAIRLNLKIPSAIRVAADAAQLDLGPYELWIRSCWTFGRALSLPLRCGPSVMGMGERGLQQLQL